MILRGVATLVALLAAVIAATAQAATSVASLLASGYEVKTAFAGPGGDAYIILQRGTSAYMCHSAPRQTCEKLN